MNDGGRESYEKWLRSVRHEIPAWGEVEKMSDPTAVNPPYEYTGEPKPVPTPGPVDPHITPQNVVPTPDVNPPLPYWSSPARETERGTLSTHFDEVNKPEETDPMAHLSDYERKRAEDWNAIREYDEKIRGFNRGG